MHELKKNWCWNHYYQCWIVKKIELGGDSLQNVALVWHPFILFWWLEVLLVLLLHICGNPWHHLSAEFSFGWLWRTGFSHWLICKNKLHDGRGIQIVSFARTKVETVDHLLLSCTWAKQIWDPLKQCFDINSHPSTLVAAWTTWRTRRVATKLRDVWDMCSIVVC